MEEIDKYTFLCTIQVSPDLCSLGGVGGVDLDALLILVELEGGGRLQFLAQKDVL